MCPSLTMADFEGVEFENDDDLLIFSKKAIYPHEPSEPVDDFSFPGSAIVTQHLGVEGPSFRLLRIVPGPFEGGIYCDLVRQPLYDAGLEYSALTYSWGEGPKSAVIRIGRLSETFRITHHLFQALRRLRSATTLVYVWVDAICINQTDLEEKAAQIPLIAQIFNQAMEVVNWLGEGNWPCLSSLLDHCKRPNVWWTRVWILQETLYAASQPVFLLGTSKVLMSELLAGWRCALDPSVPDILPDLHRSADRIQKDTKLLREGFEQVSKLYAAWVDQSSTGIVRKSLIDWIRLTVGRKCTEPVDRVYALLNIIPEREARHFHPDYRKAPPPVFNEVIHYHLFHTNWRLPALQQLVEDLHGSKGHAIDTCIPQEERWTLDEVLACTGGSRRVFEHVSWLVASSVLTPTMILSSVWADQISHVLRPGTAGELKQELLHYNLSWNERAVKQALVSYPEHFRRRIASRRTAKPHEPTAREER
ncbi:hypothetical protein CBER1_09582 [Cercospora berteroae]|uniref:Heterokaryon incompatibility domain-containing protein n=1 Tax=Cercospora berteroae TaxID=357750 RepID=A0A2S6BWN8_9PEZI|nr:hypothetical protein CBER1_09582 [Cercospora berteroae]